MAYRLAHVICLVAIFGYVNCAYQNTFNAVEDGPKSERALKKYLFKNYDKLVRPVKDAKDKITVSVGITPLRIRELNTKDQTLVLETYTAFNWTDEYLKWNPEHFGNLSVLRVPSTEVWRPDLALYTSPEQSQMFPEPATNVLVYDSGTVLWVPMFTIRSKCPMLKSKDVVTCNIQIGSWTFSILNLDVQLSTKEVDLKNFQDSNPHWKLVHILSERIEKFYPCCKEAYPSLHFNVTLKKRPSLSADGDNFAF